MPAPAALTDWTKPSDQVIEKGAVPTRLKEMDVEPPSQIVPPPDTEPDGETETGMARESLALHVPRVASTATVTGSEVPTNEREFVPWPEEIAPFVTVQTYVAPVVSGTEAVPVRPAQTREGTVRVAEGTGLTVTTAEPAAVPAQIVSVTVRTVYVVVVRGVTSRVAGLAARPLWVTPSDQMSDQGPVPVSATESVALCPAQTGPPPVRVAVGAVPPQT